MNREHLTYRVMQSFTKKIKDGFIDYSNFIFLKVFTLQKFLTARHYRSYDCSAQLKTFKEIINQLLFIHSFMFHFSKLYLIILFFFITHFTNISCMINKQDAI